MTNTPDYPPKQTSDRLMLFVAFTDMCILDYSGPMTVFWTASKDMKHLGRQGYDCQSVSVTGGEIRTAEGVTIQTRPLSDFDEATIDTIIVPGSFCMEDYVDQLSDLTTWLRLAAPRAERISSVCSGAFMLAQAGLLDGKKAATHWLMCETLQTRFPKVVVDRDAIFVHQGNVWTSAGVTACIDLALAMIETDCGRNIAMDVARELVVFMKRSGGQSQFSQFLESQSKDIGIFDELHHWIGNNLASRDLTVDMLAEQACMSPRTFARVYKQQTGRTPAKAIEMFRLEAARRLLEDSHFSITQIAKRCGFGDEERMRTTFLRNLSVAPREYRQRFSAHTATTV